VPTQAQKVKLFAGLHAAPELFVMPNPWDAGSARMLEQLGYMALATSSGASAGVLGRKDGQITRDEALTHARQIVDATDLPVNADLENCFAHDPAGVADTVRMAIDIGLAGCSVEDYAGNAEDRVYDLAHAAERVAAAAEAAHGGAQRLILTARCENYLHGVQDLDDTIKRLQAYAQAGADVLFAPGLPTLDAVRQVCSAVDKPVNFMAGIPGKSFTVPELAAAGVRRISLASSLYRAAMRRAKAAAEEVLRNGTFGYLGS
jgi:2-methylisocitrate lyase-like PEP mutase family enzyme